MIKIEEQHGEPPLRAISPRQFLVQLTSEQRTVRQAGQRVLKCQSLDVVLGPLPLDRGGKHVGDRFQEGDVVRGKLARMDIHRAERAEGSVATAYGSFAILTGSEGENRSVASALSRGSCPMSSMAGCG